MSETDDFWTELWDWIIAFLTGQKAISGDYVPVSGDKLGIVNRFSVLDETLNDADMISALDSVSNVEIQDVFYNQGLDVTITNRSSKVTTPGHEWTHGVDFDVNAAQTPALVLLNPYILGLIITAIISFFVWLSVDKITATADKFVDNSGKGTALTMNLLIVGVAVLAVIWLIGRVFFK